MTNPPVEKKSREVFVNMKIFESGVTPWREPIPYIKYRVCTTVDFSPKNTIKFIEHSAYSQLLADAMELRAALGEISLSRSSVRSDSTGITYTLGKTNSAIIADEALAVWDKKYLTKGDEG